LIFILSFIIKTKSKRDKARQCKATQGNARQERQTRQKRITAQHNHPKSDRELEISRRGGGEGRRCNAVRSIMQYHATALQQQQ
jgi:hypothetical protein